MNTALEVAEYMKAQLEKSEYLYQQEIVFEIEDKFGEAFVYHNDGGNLAIGKDVLEEFKKLTPDVVWDRREKCWRKREDYDEGTRSQS